MKRQFNKLHIRCREVTVHVFVRGGCVDIDARDITCTSDLSGSVIVRDKNAYLFGYTHDPYVNKLPLAIEYAELLVSTKGWHYTGVE